MSKFFSNVSNTHVGLVDAGNRGAKFGEHLLVKHDEIDDELSHDTTVQFIIVGAGKNLGFRESQIR